MESDIKEAICDYLEKSGFVTWRNMVTNKNGIADISVISPEGHFFLIEGKQPGKKPKILQMYRSDEIRKKTGVKTFVMDHLEDVKKLIQNGEYIPDKS